MKTSFSRKENNENIFAHKREHKMESEDDIKYVKLLLSIFLQVRLKRSYKPKIKYFLYRVSKLHTKIQTLILEKTMNDKDLQIEICKMLLLPL